MKYRITPGNVLGLIMVCFAIFIKLASKGPYNLMGGGYLLFYSIFIFLGDLFLQFMIENYKKILLIESIVLPIIIILAAIS